jgi:hypothetical protein
LALLEKYLHIEEQFGRETENLVNGVDGDNKDTVGKWVTSVLFWSSAAYLQLGIVTYGAGRFFAW